MTFNYEIDPSYLLRKVSFACLVIPEAVHSFRSFHSLQLPASSIEVRLAA